MVIYIRDEIEQLENPKEAQDQAEVQTFAIGLEPVTPWTTYCLLSILGIVFVLQELWGGSSSPLSLIRMGALAKGTTLLEPWRLVSHGFLHIGFIHLLFNGMALYVLGTSLERLLGSRRFLLLYGLSMLGGGLTIATVGTLVTRLRSLVPEGVLERMKGSVWQSILLNFANSFRPGVSLAGHLGGGLSGAFFMLSGAITAGLGPRPEVGASLAEPRLGEKAAHAWVTAASVVVGALMAASLAAALVAGRPWELRHPPAPIRQALTGTSLSLEVPGGLTAQASERKGDFETFFIGQVGRDPVAIAVLVGPVQEGADISEALPTIKEKLGAGADHPEGSVVEKPPQILSVGGRPAVFMQLRLREGFRLSVYVSIVGRRLTRVDVISDPVETWKNVPERVAGSLRDDG
jgi:rhomboid protease GluP